MSDPSLLVVTPPPRAHSIWRHVRAALIILLLLILVTGIAYPLAIGGIGVVVHRDTVNTSNNSTPSAHLRLLGHPEGPPTAPSGSLRPGATIDLPRSPYLHDRAPSPTFVYPATLGGSPMRELTSPSEVRIPASEPMRGGGV